MLKSLQKYYLENRYQRKDASELTSGGVSLQYRSNANSSSPLLTSSVVFCLPKLLNKLKTFLDAFISTFQHDGLPYPQNLPVWSQPVSA